MPRQFKFLKNPKNITDILDEDSLYLWQYLVEFLLEWELLQMKILENIETHILYSVTFFLPEIV